MVWYSTSFRVEIFFGWSDTNGPGAVHTGALLLWCGPHRVVHCSSGVDHTVWCTGPLVWTLPCGALLLWCGPYRVVHCSSGVDHTVWCTAPLVWTTPCGALLLWCGPHRVVHCSSGVDHT